MESTRFSLLKDLLEEIRRKEEKEPFHFKLRKVGIPSKGTLPPSEVFDIALGIPRIEVLRKKRYLWNKAPLEEGFVLLGLRIYAPFLGGSKLSRVSWPEILKRAPGTLLLPDPLVEPTILEALASIGEAFGRSHVSKLVLSGGLVRFLTSPRIKERLLKEKGQFGIMLASPGTGEHLPAGRLLGVVSRSSRHPGLAVRVLLHLRNSLEGRAVFGMGLSALRRVLPAAPDESLKKTASLWEGNQEEGQPENWIDTALLILFGLAFLLLLRTALRR
jgi:hypothetical protein